MGKSKQIATMLTDAPAALDTLDELAAALGDDANFATTVTNSIATKLDISNPVIDMGTNKKIEFSGNIGEVGSVPGFQARNDAGSGLRSMGLRASSLRFATGDDERLRIEDNVVGIGTESPSTTDSGYNKGALHVHNATGSGAQIRWTNSTTGTGTSDGFMISKWSDKKTYITNFDDGADTVFTQSNSSGTLVTTMTIDGDGDIGIGTTPYANARLTLGGTDSGGYPAVLQFDNNNSSGAEFFMLATDTNWSAGANKFIMGHGAPSSSNTDVTIDSSGNVGIATDSPQFKLHVNKQADNYATFSGVDENIAGFQTSYDASGSQILTFSNLNGNWVDGTSGADSAFGWVWGYQTSVRGGLVYDHRGTERMQMFSSYGTISFLTADAADGDAVPTDSNMNERLTIAPGGDVTISADSQFRSTDSSSRTATIVSKTNVVHTGAYPYHPTGDGIGNNQTNSLQLVFAHIYARQWSSGRYIHIKTDIPVSGSNYGMVVVYAKGYRYSPAGSIDSSWGFHNWSTALYSLDQRNYATTFAVNAYVSSDNYVVLVGDNQTTGTSYTGFQLSFLYANTNYPAHTQTMNGDSHKVLAASLSSSTSGVY